MNLFDGITQNFLQIGFADANTAPTDAVEIGPVNSFAERSDAVRFIFVNIIERAAGIETRFPTELNPATEATGGFHPETGQRENWAAGRTEAIVFFFGECVFVCFE